MSRKRGEEYSQDLRDRVLEASGPIRRVADLFRVSASYVSKVASRCTHPARAALSMLSSARSLRP
jgi:hypothetical protein